MFSALSLSLSIDLCLWRIEPLVGGLTPERKADLDLHPIIIAINNLEKLFSANDLKSFAKLMDENLISFENAITVERNQRIEC